MKTTEIAIIGLGGVGGYFGFKLAQKYASNDTNDVVSITFVAREETYEIVKKNGLTLLSPEHQNSIVKPNYLVKSITEIPKTDIFIICVKEYDLEKICLDLKDKINENTILLPLMNGVDIYERIRKIIPQGLVLPACVYVASHIKEKGIIEHKANAGKIIFGKDPQNPHFEPISVLQILQKANINVEYKENPFVDIWTKFFFIASFGLVSARYNKTMGEISESGEFREKAILIMKEIEMITQKKGINVAKNIIALTFEKAMTFPYQTPTSIQLDVQGRKKANELELFAGAIINLGKELDISVVETQKIYDEIKKELE